MKSRNTSITRYCGMITGRTHGGIAATSSCHRCNLLANIPRDEVIRFNSSLVTAYRRAVDTVLVIFKVCQVVYRVVVTTFFPRKMSYENNAFLYGQWMYFGSSWLHKYQIFDIPFFFVLFLNKTKFRQTKSTQTFN